MTVPPMRAGRELAWSAAFFTLVTLVYLAPLLARMSTSMPENPADARLNAWTLAWGASRLPYALDGFWSPPIYYPYTNALAYTENLLGITVLVAPVQWLFGEPVLAYNVALLLSFVVSALGAYLLAREITGSACAAFVAGCAFGFAPYRWSQIGHLQVLFAGWLAIALWALHRALRTRSWGMLAVVAVAVPLQILANGYSAFQAAIAIPLVILWSIVADPPSRRMIAGLAGAGVVIGCVLVPAAMVYGRMQEHFATTTRDLMWNSADVGSYFAEVPGLPLAHLLPGVNSHEGYLFPGVAVTLLAVVAVVARGPTAAGRTRWLYLAIGLAAALLSLGPVPHAWGYPLPWAGVYSWLLDAVPALALVRVPARFGMLALLACAMLAGMGAARVAAVLNRPRRLLLLAAIAGAIVFEGYGGPLTVERQRRLSPERAGPEYVWLAQQPAGAVLHLPIAGIGDSSTLQHQFATMLHGHPIVNGVSRRNPVLPRFLSSTASPFVEASALDQAVPFLRGLGIRYLMVRPEDFVDPEVARQLLDTLGDSASAHVRLAAVFLGVRAYEIAPIPPRTGVAGPPLAPVSPATFRLSASDEPARLGRAVDGDPGTRWFSGRPQNGTAWVEVEFDRPRTVARVGFTMTARNLSDFPRGLEISAEPRNGEPAPILYQGTVLEALGRGWVRTPDQPVAWIDFPARMTRRLLIRQTGTSPFWFWSIDEMSIWEVESEQ